MKEATGEFSMTVVTIIAIVAIAGIITFLRDPIKNFIKNTFESSTNTEIERQRNLNNNS